MASGKNSSILYSSKEHANATCKRDNCLFNDIKSKAKCQINWKSTRLMAVWLWLSQRLRCSLAARCYDELTRLRRSSWRGWMRQKATLRFWQNQFSTQPQAATQKNTGTVDHSRCLQTRMLFTTTNIAHNIAHMYTYFISLKDEAIRRHVIELDKRQSSWRNAKQADK